MSAIRRRTFPSTPSVGLSAPSRCPVRRRSTATNASRPPCRLEHVAPRPHNGRVKATKGRHMAAKLAPGGKAPDFELPSDDGDTVRLADFKGKKLVVYFYPKADTPGCTRESIAFSKLKSSFSRAETALLGRSE